MAETPRFCVARGGWQVQFEPSGQSLVCRHAPSRAEARGTLAFETEAAEAAWSIVLPRDSVCERLALLDGQGNVQGYVAFRGTGDALSVHVVHRAAQRYRGTLSFEGTARLGEQTFACRTRPPAECRVVQMASGHADSALNDSLFDIGTDTALRLDGKSVAIATRPSQGHEPPVFDIEMTACPHQAAHSALVLDVVADYYRAAYVPYYKPVDRARCPSPPTGWMSWNVYFDQAGEAENLAEARVAAEHLKPFGLEVWSIESWQDNSAKLPVRDFHNLTLRPYAAQFPHGMKWLAEQIRALGFRPGLWSVPWGTGDEAFYQAHKEWFLHDPDGTPMSNWSGRYVLDISQAAVRQHMEDTHRTISREWGYEFFKLDGVSGKNHGYSAHFYERDEVRAAMAEPCEHAFALCLEALRRGIGPDRIVLAGTHYTGPEVKHFDATRIGSDIVSPNQPIRWHNVLDQARTTLNQLFVHNIVWYSDPDTLLVGEASALEVARISATVVGLPGQVMFAGDKLAELLPERMRLLQRCLPVCDVRPLDLYPIFELSAIWDLKVRRPFGAWDVVSVFNWGDEPAELGFGFAELGLDPDADYLVYEFWSQQHLGVHRERLAATVPPRSNLLLAVHPALGRPQFLSTDRHVTQGGVSLEALAWDEERAALSGGVRLVGNVPTTLTFFVPEGYELEAAEADDAETLGARAHENRTLTLTLQRRTSGAAAWALAFSRTSPGTSPRTRAHRQA